MVAQQFLLEQGHFGEYVALDYDYGQSAMWRGLQMWRTNVAKNITGEVWNEVANSIQSTVISLPTRSVKANEIAAQNAYYIGGSLYTEACNEAANQGIDNEYGIVENYYNGDSKQVETRKEVGNETILGPFKYNFTGTIKNGKPTLTFNSSSASQSYTIGTYSGSVFTATNQIVSGNSFYIKVPASSLNDVSNIHFNFQIEGINFSNTTTTINFFERTKNASKYQPIIYVEQNVVGNQPHTYTYTISKKVDVSLQKLDISGSALKAEGIQFQIRNAINAVVAYFKTDANGNGIVTDSNGNPTGTTTVQLMTDQTYKLVETQNNAYGYKNYYLTASNMEIAGATSIVQSGNDIKFTLGGNSPDQVTIKAKNDRQLADLEIVKTGENNAALENVKFVVQTNYGNKYLQLRDSSGNSILEAPKGTITINSSEYSIAYVDNKDSATKFVTDSNGKVLIKNLEVYQSQTAKIKYTAIEQENTNYGYGVPSNIGLNGNTELTAGEKATISITNTQALGNLKLEKYDANNHNIILPNVGFVIEVSPSPQGTYTYLTLYKENGDREPSIDKGVATINKNNKANATEYRLDYYETSKPYKELTEQERKNITIFKTGNDATLIVNNLEVYSSKTTEQYTYKLIEVSNDNYGYVASYQELGGLKLEKDKTLESGLGNQLVCTKISGYVWIENTQGKANEYDNIYTDNGNDQKLTDLYILENGELVKNPNAVTPVEIKLRNKATGEIIKALPDEFDETGKYTFVNVLVSELENYEVVFVYDGFYYTTIATSLDTDTGSKVKEVIEEREALNNKFASVEDNAQVVSTDGTINSVEYLKNGHTSSLSKLNFETTVSANTNTAGYNLKEKHNALVANSTGTMQTLENVNMGIVLREQPKISINSDIYSSLIEFEGYKYNYKYNGRQNYYENVNGDDIGVKFEQEYTAQRYTRTVYASDIQAAQDLNKEIKLSITYKIQLANQSKTLSVLPSQIINYFDSRYEIEAVGLGLDEANHTVTNTLNYSTPQAVQGLDEKYKSTVITFNELIETKERVKDLYITFNVSREAILDLLKKTSTYHNASEILSYTSYYGTTTSKADGEANGAQFITDTTEAGAIYAGIDKMSQPGNIELKLIDHSSGEGTQVLDTADFEDDSTSAPSLILEASEARKVSGTIWEDVATNTANNQKLGDGIFNKDEEKVVKDVKVELYKIDDNGKPTDIAKYSNGTDVRTTTNEEGNYTFGYYDEDAKKHVGILPGKYVIKYTYNNESYIVGNRNINLDDYKSTIITSEVVKNAFEQNNNQRWYIVEENNRYSDARDDLSLRKEYGNTDTNFTITNSTYNNIIALENMYAYTPIIDIGIEFTELDEANALTLEFVKESKNIDFGIVERPRVDIEIKKEITGLEIVAQNGTSIIPYGDPTDTNSRMQYVKNLQEEYGKVSVEIESDLLQGAELNLEYTITLVNNSDKDYAEKEYYYYGTGGRTEITTRAKQVVDYMSSTMTLNIEKTPDVWKEVTASDLYNGGNGLISEQTNTLLGTGNYIILTTNAFEEVGAGSDKSVKLYATKYLAISNLTIEENNVEIIEIIGTRTIKDSIPGNYEPTESSTYDPTEPPTERDTDRVELIITPPTGTAVNYEIYIIAALATLAIIASGIVIIKKKLIK